MTKTTLISREKGSKRIKLNTYDKYIQSGFITKKYKEKPVAKGKDKNEKYHGVMICKCLIFIEITEIKNGIRFRNFSSGDCLSIAIHGNLTQVKV